MENKRDDKDVMNVADYPLQPGGAIGNDRFGRQDFALSVVDTLLKMPKNSSCVVAIEGCWGSGKTSILALMEDFAKDDDVNVTAVVRFNPWLIGNRDALLKQFLQQISNTLELSSPETAKKVAKELKAYSGLFDVIGLIPGAEPLASIIKTVITNVGNVTESIADQKTPSLEGQRENVVRALLELEHPILVFIDDLDRLFQQEVFEMIRIIKAVADFPNIRYVVAWDPAYITCALEKLNIPFHGYYLDKVVQYRLPIPALSNQVKFKLFDEQIKGLPKEAHCEYFPEQNELLWSLYHMHGLKDILEQPRDFFRLGNSIRFHEKHLRGEIVLSDIVGLAALSIKARPVYDLLMKEPRYFLGAFNKDWSTQEDMVKKGKEEVEQVIEQCSPSYYIGKIVEFLFPKTKKDTATIGSVGSSSSEGRICSSERFLFARGLGSDTEAILLRNARRYISITNERDEIMRNMSYSQRCELLELICDFISKSDRRELFTGVDWEDFCVDISQVPDKFPPGKEDRERMMLNYYSTKIVERAIINVVKSMKENERNALYKRIITADTSLSTAALLLNSKKQPSRQVTEDEWKFFLSGEGDPSKKELLLAFANNCLAAIKQDRLWACELPSMILKVLTVWDCDCKAIYSEIEKKGKIDEFVRAYLSAGKTSGKGEFFELRHEMNIEKYVSLEELRKTAERRLLDEECKGAYRAAWRSVNEKKTIYANGDIEPDSSI